MRAWEPPTRRTDGERGSCAVSRVVGRSLYDQQSARVAEQVRRDRFKPDCPLGRVGSSPTPGTSYRPEGDTWASSTSRLENAVRRRELAAMGDRRIAQRAILGR